MIAIKSVLKSLPLSVKAVEMRAVHEGVCYDLLENGKIQVFIKNDCDIVMATLNFSKLSNIEFGVLVDEVKRLIEIPDFKCNFLFVSHNVNFVMMQTHVKR